MHLIDQDLVSEYDRLPPHDEAAERCVLASMMLDRDAIPLVRAMLGTDAFFQTDNQVIARVLFDMHDERKPVDVVLLRAELRRRNLLDDVGGAAYLGAILNSVPSAAHVEHYAGVVKEQAMRRCLINICNDALRDAYKPSKGAFTAPAAEALLELSMRAMQATTSSGMMKVRTLREVGMEVAESLGKPGEMTLIPTGLAELDDMIGGLPRGRKTIVAAKAGMGKSAFIKQVLENAAFAGVPVGLITVEEDAQKVARNRLAAASGVENNRIAQNKTTSDECSRVKLAAPALPANFHLMDTPRKLSEIVAAAHLLATRHGCRVIAVDHLHLIDGEKEDRESREREVAKISAKLKGVWKELNVAGVEACQLNRGSGYDRPTPANLRDSGTLEQDGDVILLLHREDFRRRKEWKQGDAAPVVDGILEINVAKNKDGAEGVKLVDFDEAIQVIRDRDPF